MTLEVRAQLLESLRDPEYRREFVAEHLSTGLAFQLRHLRESREWTQEGLAQQIGKTQELISQWENPDYGRYSLTTLKAFAEVFDVALLVKFAPFSELVDWVTGLTSERLAPKSFGEDRKNVVSSGFSLASTGVPSDLGGLTFPLDTSGYAFLMTGDVIVGAGITSGQGGAVNVIAKPVPRVSVYAAKTGTREPIFANAA
jgi:transcriptional regulator with XRE-family HTH domain